MQLGNFMEAREQFARAHALHPNARTLRGLGISEFELRHYAIAERQLTAALASDVKPLEGKLRSDTEALLGRAKTYVGELHIEVSPANAMLSIDGNRQPRRAASQVRLDVGDHVLDVQADGHASERRPVTVRGGQTEHLQVRLAPLPASRDATSTSLSGSPAGDARVDQTPVYKRWWLWTIVGVVIAGAAAGTAIAIKAKNEPTEYRAVRSANTPVGAGLQPLWVY